MIGRVSLGWKTLTGAALWALGQVSRPEVLALLPERAAAIVSAAGALLGALGIRHAIAKIQVGRY